MHWLLRRWWGQGPCPHQRRRSRCKECGGASICQHQRRMSTCKECGGSSICPHHRQKSTCKECGVGGQATRARHRGGGEPWIGKETATCQASSDPAAALIDTRDQSLFSDKLVALAVASLSLLQPSSKLCRIARSLGEISSLCQSRRCKQQLRDRRIVKDGVTWKANCMC